MSPGGTPSRWCPTPEQVMILEEIYRNGLKTPNATQIQHITCHLSLYGKIEGKNVFYWFQNHKARDRQKLRRKLYKQIQHQQQMLVKRHRFDDHQLFHYFLHHHHHHQRLPPLLPLPTACFLEEREGEEGSTTKVEGSGRTWFGGDDGTTVAKNVGRDVETTTCCNETLRTLELFPMRGSWVKEEESGSGSGSGNGGWGH